MILFNALGAIAMASIPATAIVSTEDNTKNTYENNEKIPKGLFANKYTNDKDGLKEFMMDYNKIYRDKIEIDIDRLSDVQINKIMKSMNKQLGKRGFFSFIADAFKTVVTSVAAGVTFGQVDAINEAVIDSAHGVAANAKETGEFIHDSAGVVLGALGAESDGGASLSEALAGFDGNNIL